MNADLESPGRGLAVGRRGIGNMAAIASERDCNRREACKASRRLHAIWLLVCSPICLLAAVGCSHTTPYVRSGFVQCADTYLEDHQTLHRIVLAGDCGDTTTDSMIIGSLREWAAKLPRKTIVVFLGDNIYPKGLPEEGDPKREAAERSLRAQLDIIQHSGARGFFTSGNHDWADDGPGGLQAVRRQEEYVREASSGSVGFLPPNGSPGPVKIDLEAVRLIVLNTPWWLHDEGAAASPDPSRSKDEVVQRLKTLLASAGDRHVVVIAHHPIKTYGTHGGFYDWKDHLFPSRHLDKDLWIPTPILGSLYPLLWHYVYNKQALSGAAYQEMGKRLVEALSTKRPLIYASGHDHSLQVLDGEGAAEYLLIAALGSDVESALGHGHDTIFAHLHAGFMVVDFLQDDRVLLRVVEPGDKEVVFTMWLQGRSVAPGSL